MNIEYYSGGRLTTLLCLNSRWIILPMHKLRHRIKPPSQKYSTNYSLQVATACDPRAEEAHLFSASKPFLSPNYPSPLHLPLTASPQYLAHKLYRLERAMWLYMARWLNSTCWKSVSIPCNWKEFFTNCHWQGNTS